jgi:hypothetical protein
MKSTTSRNKKEELKIRQQDFEVGELVMAHLRRERFPRGNITN